MLLHFISTICKCTISSHQKNADQEDSEQPSAAPTPTHQSSSEDDYEPYAHGNQKHPLTFWCSIFHLFKFAVGTGILSLPYAFKSVGYGVAIFGVILVACIYIHITHKLLEVEYVLCKKLRKPNLTYAGVMEHSFKQGPQCIRKFAQVAKFTVYFHYIFNKSISNATYLVTIGGNLKVIVDHYFNINIKIVSVITPLMIIIVSLALIKNLKRLAPLSLLTSALNLINFALILTTPFDYSGLSDFNAITDLTKFPYYFSLTMAAFTCTVIVMPLKNDMKEPKKFAKFFGVLDISTSATGILYCVFGSLGYAKYGDHVQPNILHNLPPDQLIPLVILSLFSCTICISFILTLYVALDIIKNNILAVRELNHPKFTEYIVRIALCIVPYCIAITLPDFKMMAALGGVIAVLMDETVPITLHILLLLQKKPKTICVYLALMKDLALFLICSFIFVSTLRDLTRNIVKFYS